MNLMNSLILSIFYVLILAVEETTVETGSKGDSNERQSSVSGNKEGLKQRSGGFGTKSKENLINLKNKAVENLSNYNKKLKELTGKAKEDMLVKREATIKKIKQYNTKLKELGVKTKENLKALGTKVFGKFGKKQPKNKPEQENEESGYLEPIQLSKKNENKPEAGKQQPAYLETIPEEEEENIYEELNEPIYQNESQGYNQNKNQPLYENVGQSQ